MMTSFEQKYLFVHHYLNGDVMQHNNDDGVNLQKLLEEKSREVEDSYKRIYKMREEVLICHKDDARNYATLFFVLFFCFMWIFATFRFCSN